MCPFCTTVTGRYFVLISPPFGLISASPTGRPAEAGFDLEDAVDNHPSWDVNLSPDSLDSHTSYVNGLICLLVPGRLRSGRSDRTSRPSNSNRLIFETLNLSLSTKRLSYFPCGFHFDSLPSGLISVGLTHRPAEAGFDLAVVPSVTNVDVANRVGVPVVGG